MAAEKPDWDWRISYKPNVPCNGCGHAAHPGRRCEKSLDGGPRHFCKCESYDGDRP